MKVHQLAKELGFKSRDLIPALQDAGIEVKAANSKITEEQVEQFKAYVAKVEKTEIKKPTVGQLQELVEQVLGGEWFSGGSYDLNLIFLRNDLEEDAEYDGDVLFLDANTFNDLVCIAYRASGRWVVECYPVTVDPGVAWRKDPKRNGGGVGIVVEGQYRLSHELGLHGDEESLVQCGVVSVYRDADFNEYLTLDPETIEAGYGFNSHDAGQDSDTVDRWSGGCLVTKREHDMFRIIELLKEQHRRGKGKKVSVSLGRFSWIDNAEKGRKQFLAISKHKKAKTSERPQSYAV